MFLKGCTGLAENLLRLLPETMPPIVENGKHDPKKNSASRICLFKEAEKTEKTSEQEKTSSSKLLLTHPITID